MLTIKELTVKNFMSVGNQAQAIDFSNKSLVLVIGENMDLGGDDAGARNGTGKTTIAKALCNEVGCDYLFINGSEESGIDVLRTKIRGYASTMSFDGGSKVVILDEADYLNPQSTQPALRAFIEEFEKHCTFILTCNYANRIISPLHSRCQVIDFKVIADDKQRMAGAFMKRVGYILDLSLIHI
mgnify:CR=1 FL=1